ncbi:bcl-2-like protein 13 isoform X2 [Anolis carolinensis]|uniref:bcl-2-like protein 13 isoform X2 n=1 Tax=Anolis carolinensis TaxID=28377 RepID=UPI0007DB86A2|nr:PREDICTED: bcl-2-like protein 13 isoform X2 [Anolis carolinensis]|eukprot:XP_016849105.1 PREDICTED: bcl-2-like protein 13 isoform X2 [Anolis carolinensis]
MCLMPVTYQEYRERTQEAAAHASGWNKVLVPLVILQQFLVELSRRGQEPLGALLNFGVTYLEDYAADYIIQQGGWGTVFSLDSEDEEYHGIIAEDSNDIYILTSDNSGQVSPPESPTVTTSWQSESLPVSLSASQSWHTESLPVSLGPESWQQVAMDPEEVKSLDSNGGGEERSENNSSNSDIVHVEKEEIPEGVEETAGSEAGLQTEPMKLVSSETPAVLLKGESEAETVPVKKPSPSAPPLAELQQEGKVLEPSELESLMMSKPVPMLTTSEEQAAPKSESILLSEETAKASKESHSEEKGKSPAGEEKPILLPEGKSILLYGGAAAVAILAVAVGVALALRKK